jgi:hypothetical protein
MNSTKIGFIHITKSGGTNIKDKNKNNELYFGGYHYEDSLFYYNKGMPSFAILRNPIERYESMFYYNTFGSNKYGKTNDIKDINVFVKTHYDNPTFINKFENGMQFRKQVDWLNQNDSYVILFDKEKLIENIETFLFDEFSIKYIYDYSKKRINVSNIKNKVQLTDDSINKIKILYNEDVQLYNKLLKYQKENSKYYCKLKEL